MSREKQSWTVKEEEPQAPEQNDEDDVELQGEELEERIAPAQVGLPIGRPAS